MRTDIRLCSNESAGYNTDLIKRDAQINVDELSRDLIDKNVGDVSIA